MAAIPNPDRVSEGSQKYQKQLATLMKKPLNALGRRILVRQALLSKHGHVGAAALAAALNCEELTVWKFLKSEDGCWYERYGKNGENIKLAKKLCEYLKVDHSWLFDTIDYGDLGKVNFDLIHSRMWRLP